MDRRRFLGVVGGGTLAWPRALQALEREIAVGGAADDEAYWGLVRAQFLIPADRIYLNNGTLGPSPRVVVEAVAERTRRVAATYPPGVAWDDLKQAMADLMGGDPGGFVFPRNTTEAMSFVAGGLELVPGDEDRQSLPRHLHHRYRASRSGVGPPVRRSGDHLGGGRCASTGNDGVGCGRRRL